MSKPWVGYLGSGLTFVAGILMIGGGSYIAGSILILLSIVGIVLKLFLNKKQNG